MCACFSWPTTGPTQTQPLKQPSRKRWAYPRGRRPLASPFFPTSRRNNHLLGRLAPWGSSSINTTQRRWLERPLYRRCAGSGPAAAETRTRRPSYLQHRTDHADTLLGSSTAPHLRVARSKFETGTHTVVQAALFSPSGCASLNVTPSIVVYQCTMECLGLGVLTAGYRVLV